MKFWFILVCGFLILSKLSAQSNREIIRDQLSELTYEAWTDTDSWVDLSELPVQLFELHQNGQLDEFSTQLLVRMKETIDNWDSLSGAERTAYATDAGFFFGTGLVLSVLTLKVGVTAGRSLRSSAWHRFLKTQAYRIGPKEPSSLPDFVYSRTYENFQDKISALTQLRRREKRLVRAYFRSRAIYLGTGSARYRLNYPQDANLSLDEWKSLESDFDLRFQKYRDRRVDQRWETMPKNYQRFFGESPHVDEVLRNVVDFTMDHLSERQQRQMIGFLGAYILDIKSRKKLDRSSFRPWLRRYFNVHPELRSFILKELAEGVRNNEHSILSTAMAPLESYNTATIISVRERMRREFRDYSCRKHIRWLALPSY